MEMVLRMRDTDDDGDGVADGKDAFSLMHGDVRYGR